MDDDYNEYGRLDDFNTWFSLFLEEKELDDIVFEFEDVHQWHFLPVGIIKEFLANVPHRIQENIKTKLIQIDFHDGDVKDFLEYIAKGITTNFNF